MNPITAFRLWRQWKPVIEIAEKGWKKTEKIMGRNWKTTLAGILTLIITVATAAQVVLAGGHVDLTQTLTGLTAGLGLILAKDHNVTGVTNPTPEQKQEAKAEVVEVLKKEGVI